MAKTTKPTATGKPAAPAKKEPEVRFKIAADNRRARHEYSIIEVFEAGIALVGTEVKSIRQGKANLSDAFAKVEAGEMWLYSCHISPYDHGNRNNHDPIRKRKLLLHQRQISKIKALMQEKGLTLVPLKLYFKGNWAKVDLALARGKQLYDKRADIAKKDTKRQIDRVMKESLR
ncbi:MAG: SsrA-binding protein SmpB [Candidatus Obscuribacterales bacterium]|jgi:SsrA-binding protein|nr:SsrA-binding protein SmpB [Candidatus Obscuribacterales bacterium]